MGRPSWSNRNTVEECKTVDIYWLARHDYFCGFRRGSIDWRNAVGEDYGSIELEVSVENLFDEGEYVRFIYAHTNMCTGEKSHLDYKAKLVTTSCNFGGVRYWFVCPLITNGMPCSRRVGKLYLPPRAEYFGCRHCYNLTYRSQKEHDKRVDALLKNPELLMSQLQRRSSRSILPAIKAYFKVIKDR